MANSNYENRIFLQDSRMMTSLPDKVVDLMVTSPPYNVTKQYDDNLSLNEYLQLLEDVLREVWRVLKPGGLAAVNIANVGRKPYIPLDCYVIEILQEIGYKIHQEIIWAKDASAGGSCAWGSWQSASNPSLRDVHEYIILAMKPKKPNTPDLRVNRRNTEEFWKNIPKELDNKPLTLNQEEIFTNVWSMGTESARRVNHPAPFRVELPFRLIQLFSQPGDLILDPFMGSGSTALAALSSGRKFVGFEINAQYIEIANQRLAALTTTVLDDMKAQVASFPDKKHTINPVNNLEGIPETVKTKTKKGTQTTDFGVSKRESHDATRFYSSHLYDGLQINLGQPVIDRSLLLADRFHSQDPTQIQNHIENLDIVPDYSVHLIISQIPLYDTSIFQNEQKWINKMQLLIRNYTRILVTGGRIVLICRNEAKTKRTETHTKKPTENHSSIVYYPTHARISHLLIQEKLILRGNVILTPLNIPSNSSDPSNPISGQLSSAYDIAILGCKKILKRYKSPPKKLKKGEERLAFIEKTDSITRDQFLTSTKSIWRPDPTLMTHDLNQLENLSFSQRKDYLQRFLHLFSFTEDTIIMGFSPQDPIPANFLTALRKNILYFTL